MLKFQKRDGAVKSPGIRMRLSGAWLHDTHHPTVTWRLSILVQISRLYNDKISGEIISNVNLAKISLFLPLQNFLKSAFKEKIIPWIKILHRVNWLMRSLQGILVLLLKHKLIFGSTKHTKTNVSFSCKELISIKCWKVSLTCIGHSPGDRHHVRWLNISNFASSRSNALPCLCFMAPVKGQYVMDNRGQQNVLNNPLEKEHKIRKTSR